MKRIEAMKYMKKHKLYYMDYTTGKIVFNIMKIIRLRVKNGKTDINNNQNVGT